MIELLAGTTVIQGHACENVPHSTTRRLRLQYRPHHRRLGLIPHLKMCFGLHWSPLNIDKLCISLKIFCVLILLAQKVYTSLYLRVSDGHTLEASWLQVVSICSTLNMCGIRAP